MGFDPLVSDRAYLHGYTPDEQARLYAQARTLEAGVFEGVDFPPEARKLLEVGCGVGAQTGILLERFPRATVSGVDVSQEQIARARATFEKRPDGARARFEIGDGVTLPFPGSSHDGAFVCWVLEHVREPVTILREIRRVLRPGATIHLNEVFNRLFYTGPVYEATGLYWSAYNRFQEELGGDPFVGARLGQYLSEAGFSQIRLRPYVEHWDSRAPRERGEKARYWTNLMLSGAPQLLESGKVTREDVLRMQQEMSRVESAPDGMLFLGWMKASAVVPVS